MIPLKLHIKNFLSYGSPAQIIDFTPYHLICLSGKNGHGKSALLDALTWAVWGHARKGISTAKADEGLIRLGQTHMMVSLDFICNNQSYRVRREFTYERNKGVTQLDFGILDATDTFHELTDKTIRATQAKIDATIGFDYESFINSVFLRQGNSNEFSKKSPKERKEILGNILGLAKYEALRKHALERSREGTISATHIKKSCELLTAETSAAAMHQEQLAQLVSMTAEIHAQEQKYQEQRAMLSDEKKEMSDQLHKVHKQRILHDQIAITIETNRKKIGDLFTTWRTVARTIRAQKEQSKIIDDADKRDLENELELVQKKMQQRLAATQTLMQATAALQAVKADLQQQHHEQQQQQAVQLHQLETKLQVLKTELATATDALQEVTDQQKLLDAELATIRLNNDTLEKTNAQLTKEQLLFDRRKSFYHAWVNRGNKLALELRKIALQMQQLTTNTAQSCPLCEQEMAYQQMRIVHERLGKQEDRLKHQINRLSDILPRLKELLTQQYETIQKLKEACTKLTQEIARRDTITAQQEQLAKLRATKENLIKQYKNSEEQLQKELSFAQKQKNIFAIPLEALLIGNDAYRAALQKTKLCEQAVTESAYDEQRYATIQRKLADYSAQENKQHELQQQATLQKKRAEDIRELCIEIKRLRAEQATMLEASSAYDELQKNIAKLDEREQQIARDLQIVMRNKEALAHQRGSVEQICERIKQQESTLQQQTAELVQLEQELQEYQILAQALSKDGIQGLLIENVIPELETEANDLLARLTNNQAQLSIESIRDLKSGGTKETLEIKITDALGVRPYELFSGGEAFRIDFALRLAVSKLLARRTGTSLQTLIIDEGFGSQDEEGLNNIMESLYSIQDDFAKIIIVSHLPTMKDQFPVHFTITKTPRGSMVHIIEQG